jgi:hypothetical protein
MKTTLDEFVEMIDDDRIEIKTDLEFSITTLSDMLSKYNDGEITGEQLAYTSKFVVDALSSTMDRI